MQITIENSYIRVAVDDHGAQMCSLVRKDTELEYLWCGDAAYWGRQSPILFPLVGSLKGKQFSYEGISYAMGQHGFARDMDFSLVSRTEDEVWFSLSSDESTYEKYPFAFTLEIGYKLEKNACKVMWHVVNEDDKTLYFSIGGHPAFLCPIQGEGVQEEYTILTDAKGDLQYGELDENGLLAKKDLKLATDAGRIALTKQFFDRDALIFENHQAHQVSLCKPDGKAYLTVRFEAPLFGLWSPAGKGAPFICIEPWYGRCDGADFEGTWEEREYGNALVPGQQFEAEYEIVLED